MEEIRKQFIKYIQEIDLTTAANLVRSQVRNKFTLNARDDTKIALFRCALQYNIGQEKWRFQNKKNILAVILSSVVSQNNQEFVHLGTNLIQDRLPNFDPNQILDFCIILQYNQYMWSW